MILWTIIIIFFLVNFSAFYYAKEMLPWQYHGNSIARGA